MGLIIIALVSGLYSAVWVVLFFYLFPKIPYKPLRTLFLLLFFIFGILYPFAAMWDIANTKEAIIMNVLWAVIWISLSYFTKKRFIKPLVKDTQA